MISEAGNWGRGMEMPTARMFLSVDEEAVGAAKSWGGKSWN
jgi:hypothetical protein